MMYSLQIVKHLLYLVNQYLITGIFPEELKISKVIPVFKDKRDKQCRNNYRPISYFQNYLKFFNMSYINPIPRK